jgi:hypothetical protein
MTFSHASIYEGLVEADEATQAHALIWSRRAGD